MLEFQREYICLKCKHRITVEADYELKNQIVPPKKCQKEDCNSSTLSSCGDLVPGNCKDYQEIKLQETVTKLGVGCMPDSMWVTLEDDLVNSCQPGDNVTLWF